MLKHLPYKWQVIEINYSFTNKFWTRLGIDKHQSLATLLTIGDVATKCILTNLKRTSKASWYDTIGSTTKPEGVYVV